MKSHVALLGFFFSRALRMTLTMGYAVLPAFETMISHRLRSPGWAELFALSI
jgi:hypothetical protein